MRLLGFGFLYSMLSVNIVGSLILGLLTGWFALKSVARQRWRLFLATGMLGGFTTYSTFSLEVALLCERGAMSIATFYVLASLAGAVAALFLGLFVVRSLA